jgi:Allene oxide cyclase barrel like domain
MRKLILSIAAAALAAASLTALSPASAHDHHGRVVKLTTKTLVESRVDVGEPGPTLGDGNVITEDAYRDGKKVGSSDLACTILRLDLPQHFFGAQCFNTTVLPDGQITSQGYVTSDEIEKVPFKQAITGGTGAYRGARGELTVDEAGDGPAHLTFDLGR